VGIIRVFVSTYMTKYKSFSRIDLTSTSLNQPFLFPFQVPSHTHSAPADPPARSSSAVHQKVMFHPLHVGTDDAYVVMKVDVRCRFRSQDALSHRLQGHRLRLMMTPAKMIRRMRVFCGICNILSLSLGIFVVDQQSAECDVLLDFLRPAPSLSTVSSVHITLRPCASPPRRCRDPIGSKLDGPEPKPEPSSRG
jgi:hypothetical protein